MATVPNGRARPTRSPVRRTLARGGVIARIVAAAVLLVAQTAAMVAVPHAIADANADDISVGPRTLELLADNEQHPVSALLTVTMTGPSAAQVSLQVADAVAAPNGGLQVATIGSTGWSLVRIATVAPATINYNPNGGTQTFTVTVTVSGVVVRSPKAGFITTTVLEVVPASGGGTTLSQGLVVNTPVIAAPAASITDQSLIAKANLFGASISAVPSRPWLAIDQVVPDFIPGLVNHGPMSVTARIVNTGDTILRTETTFTFSQIPFQSWFSSADDPGTELLRTKAATGYALPGQAATISASSATSSADSGGSGGDDLLPAIGLIKVTATTTGSVGGVAAPTLVQYQTIVLFPWKEGIGGLLVVIALFPLLARALRSFFRAIRRIVTAPFRAVGRRLPSRAVGRAATPKRGGEVDEQAIAERLSVLTHDDQAASAEAEAAAEAAAATGAGFLGEGTGSFYRPGPTPTSYGAAPYGATGYGAAGRSGVAAAGGAAGGAKAGADEVEPQAIPGPPRPCVPTGPRIIPGDPNAGSACTI